MRYSYDVAPWERPFLFLSSLRPCIVHHHSIITGGAGVGRFGFFLTASGQQYQTYLAPNTKDGKFDTRTFDLSGDRKEGGTRYSTELPTRLTYGLY